MDVQRLWYLTFMIIGIGLFFGFTMPCLNGPLNVLKFLRDKIGKPFSCPVCSFLWPVIFASAFISWIPMMVYVVLGSLGWGILFLHISGYQTFYQGMEGE